MGAILIWKLVVISTEIHCRGICHRASTRAETVRGRSSMISRSIFTDFLNDSILFTWERFLISIVSVNIRSFIIQICRACTNQILLLDGTAFNNRRVILASSSCRMGEADLCDVKLGRAPRVLSII